jgi:calcineurin-like phosphoesterase family protein
MERFFTGDSHFNHDLIAISKREFRSVEEHDNFFIKVWNDFVTNRDEVYHLGDFCFGSHDIVRKVRARLNGKIHLILGNHDHKNRIQNIEGLFTSISDIKQIKISGNKVILCHYAMRVWPSSHFNSWQLYAHSHGGLPGVGKQMDVGLDAVGYRLLTEYDIIEAMRTKENNINYIGDRK